MAIDPVVDRIIVSRRKSIQKLEQDMVVLEQHASQALTPAGRLVYQAQIKLKAQRKAMLLGELEALAAEQPELPLVKAVSAPPKGR